MRGGFDVYTDRMPQPDLSNHFLIAVPALDDPNFCGGVTLLCRHDADGAMGILINRSSDIRLCDVFEQLGIEDRAGALSAQHVLIGGPVHPERGFVLHADDGREWDSSFRVSETVLLTTSRDILDAIAGGQGPKRAVLALGCAGWGAGQLESELQDHAWLTAPASDSLIFETPVADRWQAAAHLLGVDLLQLATYVGHA